MIVNSRITNTQKNTYQSVIEGKNAHIPPVVDVIPTHDRIGEILHPNARQGVSTDLVVFVGPLRVICHIQTYVLAVAYITVSDHGIRTHSTHAYRSANYKHKWQCLTKIILMILSQTFLQRTIQLMIFSTEIFNIETEFFPEL